MQELQSAVQVAGETPYCKVFHRYAVLSLPLSILQTVTCSLPDKKQSGHVNDTSHEDLEWLKQVLIGGMMTSCGARSRERGGNRTRGQTMHRSSDNWTLCVRVHLATMTFDSAPRLSSANIDGLISSRDITVVMVGCHFSRARDQDECAVALQCRTCLKALG
jgi:hypothetical protein